MRYQVYIILLVTHIKEGDKFVPIITTAHYIVKVHTKIRINDCSTKTIKRWIYNAKEVIKKAEKLPRNDIRRYFEC